MKRRSRARFGATITRRPPLPYPGWDNTNMIPPMRGGRVPYQTLPVQPVPTIRGGLTVDHRPYPSRLWNVENPNIFPDPRKGLRGYGQYLNRKALKKWSWDSFGVGVGAMAGTMALGLLTAAVAMPKAKYGGKKAPSALRAISPFLLPSLGAGILAYLLRHQMNQGAQECPPCEPCPEVSQRVQPMYPPPAVEKVLTQPECDEGMVWDPDRGICVAAPGSLI